MSTSKPRKSRENERAFVEHVLELLQDLGDVKARAMFGGYGIFCNEKMMALVADSVLYFKVDDNSRPLFEAEQCRPFTYTRKDNRTPIVMSYFEAPAAAMERASELCIWGQRAYEAAERTAGRKRSKRKK